ncbi:Mediator of RNA polymerase II transcription subunit [Quillaja saponaria]|uniref:Mediator of RNA polymerase II transcription subunit n=1 Tax=Quillaja saponaria TaxID=32244 RepID=A0AAD7L9Y8_QUISA|nr:Mediator of RNA polymerase II transcription subunit [Quillaja saponaria]
MAATSLNSLLLPPRPLPGNAFHRQSKRLTTTSTTTTRRICAYTKGDHSSYGFGHDYDGKLVDESMVVLRKRIHEMKDEEEEAPSKWMAWEKRYYLNYCSDICEAVGLLQSLLMNTRPCLALGLLAFLMLSVTMSISMVLLNFMEFAKGTIPGIHL